MNLIDSACEAAVRLQTIRGTTSESGSLRKLVLILNLDFAQGCK